MTHKTGIDDIRKPRTAGMRLVILFFVTLSSLVGCEQPMVVPATAPATAGGIQFTILPLEQRLLELDTPSGTVKYGSPILVIPISFKNVGQDPFIYEPLHSNLQMTEMTTPLLYVAPPNLDEMPPKSKSVIEGIVLETGRVESQLQKRTTLAPGQSITDYFFFQPPDPKASNLILSIPPTLNRGKLPLLFKLKYSPPAIQGPKVYAEKEPISFDGATFTVDSHEIAYIKTKHNSEGDGYSQEPLLKINFTIKNESDNAIGYEPDHRSMGSQGPALYSGSKSIDRARLQPTVSADGQLLRPTTIRVNNSVSDYLLFLPPKQDGPLRLEYPATLFGRSGTARVQFDVKATTPPKPAELQLPKKDEEAKDAKK